ncbi:hypothetical protein AB9M62_01665 [Bacillales bacterium AN1005]
MCKNPKKQTIIKKTDKENYVAKLVLDDKKVNSNGEITAPVKKGDKVGKLVPKSRTQ